MKTYFQTFTIKENALKEINAFLTEWDGLNNKLFTNTDNKLTLTEIDIMEIYNDLQGIAKSMEIIGLNTDNLDEYIELFGDALDAIDAMYDETLIK